MSKTSKPISDKNTKNEILSAYQDLLDQLSDTKEPQQMMLSNTDEKVKDILESDISKIVGDTKSKLNISLNELGNELEIKVNELLNVNNAITEKKKEISELYKIQAGANTLYDIVKLGEDTKVQFENEKQKFIKENDALKEQIKIQRERDDETYTYEISQKRKKEEDLFEEKMKSKLNDIKLKEDEINKNFNELKELRELKSNLDNLLKSVKADTEKEITSRLQKEYDFERKMNEQKSKSEKDILEIKAKNLLDENTKLNEKVLSLEKQLVEVNKQVKDIAVKVIENQNRTFVTAKSDKEVE